MHRLTKNALRYKDYGEKETECYFCNPQPLVILKTYKYFYVTTNNFPYDVWDGYKVSRHLLVFSKKHINSFNKLRKNQLAEYMKIIIGFSGLNYDVFTRSSNSSAKSQSHFHTHLIKCTRQKIKKLEYNSSPYNLAVEY